MANAPEDFLERAKEVHPGSLSPRDFEEILQLGSEFVGLSGTHRVFVLGNYDKVKRERLGDVETAVNGYADVDCSAFQMSDFLDDDEALNGILKYRLLADYATTIIAVCEDDGGGAAIEQGMLAVLPEHLQKSHLCKRMYPSEDLERQRYSWMQSQGVFEIYRDTDRLYTWRHPDDLASVVDEVLNTATGHAAD